MIYTMDCKANITAQNAIYPTYKKVDCTLHTNANDDGFHGRLIDCTMAITTLLVSACRSWNQGIRLMVTIDDVDVSNALIGSLNIQHNKNMISTASLNLGKTIYSPRINSHIDLEKVIVVTAYINGQEKKLFTGLLDEPEAENTPAFKVIIPSRDYGKKLLDKKDTLACIIVRGGTPEFRWEEGMGKYISKREKLIEYIAEHAGITNVNIPEMDTITIANSFSHQSLWDMIQKEAIIGLYWVKFTEDNVMQLKLDDIKSDTSLYPTPDWSYDENRIIRLGYKRGKVNINKIIILGQTKQERIPHTTTTTTPEYIPGTTTLFSDSLSYAEGEKIYYNTNLNYTKTMGDFTLKIHAYGSGGGGGNIHIYVGQKSQYVQESYVITLKVGTIGDNAILIKTVDSCSAGGSIDLDGIMWVLSRDGTGTNFDKGHQGKAFTFDITVEGYPRSDIVDETTVQDTTWEVRYDQISALVTDPNSIAKYGERDGGSIEYPLLETIEQCKAIGEKIIRDSHRLGQQADFLIPFNPLIQTGQTIAITDKKIGITERYYIESINHNIETNEGKIKARTKIGGVYYT